MKKLMIAAVASMAAVGAFAVESANIVGYLNADVRQNLSVQVATFDGITVEGMDIQDIVPVVDGGAVASGDFTLQIYDEYGVISAQYVYVLGDDTGIENAPDGWYNEDGDTLITKTFGVGEAFTISAIVEGSLQYAGEVNGEETSVPVRQNLSAQGNFRPVPVDIQDIIPSVTEGDLASGDFTLQIYDEYGIISAQYVYVLGADTGIENAPDGWYNEDGDTLITKTFASGEGFNVSAAVAGELTFPALSL